MTRKYCFGYLISVTIEYVALGKIYTYSKTHNPFYHVDGVYIYEKVP